MKRLKQRLDLLVFERGLAESRSKSQALILAGQVVVNDQRVDKPGVLVDIAAVVRLKGEVLPYVSRGGLKLKKAIDAFQLNIRGKIAADIGASTGGFTDCLLQEGANKVYALDVGHGQLHEKLRQDPRVINREKVNARYLTADALPELIEVMTLDVSFISLKKVLPPVTQRLAEGGILIALIKPQFEVGRSKIGKGGVVTDPVARQTAIDDILSFSRSIRLKVWGTVDSPILGPAGNLEALMVSSYC